MRKFLVSVCCALALLASATVSDARIYVKISDGTVANDLDGRTLAGGVKGSLKLAQASAAPTGTLDAPIASLFLITCPPSTPRPCKAFFPSGNPTSAQPGDTLRLEDDTTAGARLEKFDSGASSDRVSIRALRVTSLPTGTTYVPKVVKITYGNEAGDLRALTSQQATAYTVTAAMSGNFRAAVNSLTKADACKVGLVSADLDSPDDSCLKLTVTVNGSAPIDGQGLPSIATISVPCNNNFPTLSPCGPSGSWTSANGGKFTGLNDNKSISCPSSCLPAHQGILVAKFNKANEVLQLTSSSHGTMANVTDENGGLEENLLALATEIALPRWVTYSAAIERCRAVPKTPSTNDSHNISDSNLPISIELECGNLTPAGAAGIPLVSLADSLLLPGAASTRYEASRETFIPAQSPPQGPLKFKDINTLSFLYDQFVGTDTVDNRLGPLPYVDCTGGSTRLEIPVRSSQGADLGVVRVYLGDIANGDNGKSGCNGVEQIVGADIPGNPDARVDLSGLAGNLAAPCCVTWAHAKQGSLGNALVRKIAFIVSRPVSPPSDPADNYKVTFFDGNVNGVQALSSLMVATGFTRVPTAQLSTAGVSIVITRLFSPVLNLPLGVIKVIRSGNLSTAGNNYTVTPNINMGELSPERGGKYGFSLCPSGVEETDPDLPDNTPIGICIADQATLTLN
jgi:hypothetical protein